MQAVGGKAINFLNSGAFGFTVSDLAGMGVRRISVGGTLARVAMDAFIKSARHRHRQRRKFDSFGGIMTNAELNKFFGDDRKTGHDRRVGAAPLDRPAGRPAGRRPDARPPSRAGDARTAASAGSSGWRSITTRRSGRR